MDFVIQQDIKKLVFDSNILQLFIEELIQDCEAWRRDRENDELTECAENLKRLESDVILLQADWNILIGPTHHGYSQYETVNGFQRAFESLDILFNDLKKMRAELNDSYIHHSEIESLEIDWARFKKMIAKLRQSLREVDVNLKKECTPLSFKEESYV
jgi:hypothetical protein